MYTEMTLIWHNIKKRYKKNYYNYVIGTENYIIRL